MPHFINFLPESEHGQVHFININEIKKIEFSKLTPLLGDDPNKAIIYVNENSKIEKFYYKEKDLPHYTKIKRIFEGFVPTLTEEKATKVPWRKIPDEPERPGRYAAWKNKGKP